VIGGNFAVWASMFSLFDCLCIYYRRREDAWNSIAAGALTGGVLAARGGPTAIIRNAIIGGVLLAVIEGAGTALSRLLAEDAHHQPHHAQQHPLPAK
jgi:import inner membrane translocase subunit TIM17